MRGPWCSGGRVRTGDQRPWEDINYQLERVLPISFAELLHFTDENTESQREETSSWSHGDTLYPQKGDDSDHSSFNIECLLPARYCLVLESQWRTECVRRWGRAGAGWSSRSEIFQPSRCASLLSGGLWLGTAMTVPVTTAWNIHLHSSPFLAVRFRFGLGFHSSK